MALTQKLEWEQEPDKEVAGMIERAWAFRNMADDLRAQAAQLKYCREQSDDLNKGTQAP